MSPRRTIARNPPPADDAGATVAVPVDALVALRTMMAEMLTRQKATDAELARNSTELVSLRKIVEARPAPPPGLLALGADDMTVRQAAALVNHDPETLRNWCREHGVGTFDRGRGRWIVSRRALLGYVERRFGVKV